MDNVSLRLSEELRKRLAAEAERSHKKRSEVAREAIADYLHRQERDRFIAEFMDEALALANDPHDRRERLKIQDEFAEADAETLPDEPCSTLADWVRAEKDA
jgi:predicted transcriptional regulator